VVTNEIVARLVTQPSPDEWRSLRTFKHRALELEQNSLISGGYDLSANFSWEVGERPSFTVKALPQEEPFRALLLTFRHFLANEEPSNFLRVLNIAGRHAPDAREFIDVLRTRWNDALFGGLMNMSFNNTPLTAGHIFDLWLNAHYFHNDCAKQQELDRLSAMLSPDFAKFLLANAVTECCKSILVLNHTLRKLNDPHEAI
jgi:hypothetical protein